MGNNQGKAIKMDSFDALYEVRVVFELSRAKYWMFKFRSFNFISNTNQAQAYCAQLTYLFLI